MNQHESQQNTEIYVPLVITLCNFVIQIWLELYLTDDTVIVEIMNWYGMMEIERNYMPVRRRVIYKIFQTDFGFEYFTIGLRR